MKKNKEKKINPKVKKWAYRILKIIWTIIGGFLALVTLTIPSMDTNEGGIASNKIVMPQSMLVPLPATISYDMNNCDINEEMENYIYKLKVNDELASLTDDEK